MSISVRDVHGIEAMFEDFDLKYGPHLRSETKQVGKVNELLARYRAKGFTGQLTVTFHMKKGGIAGLTATQDVRVL